MADENVARNTPSLWSAGRKSSYRVLSHAYLEAATVAARSIGSTRHFQEAFKLFHRMQKKWHPESQVRALVGLFL